MRVEAKELTKRFGRQVVIKSFNHVFEEGSTTVVLGGNGSGKSTFLKLILGMLSPSSGEILFVLNGKPQNPANWHGLISFAAPYQELIEEFSVSELLEFHFKFRRPIDGVRPNEVLEISGLDFAAHKLIKHFSSGMKQRLRLAMALLTHSELVCLDEPISNLDKTGINWFHQMVERNLGQRLLLIGSNHIEAEMNICVNHILL